MLRLQGVVARCGVPESQFASYLAFAQELAHTQHRNPAPDFTQQSKMVVDKWFRRGLSGRLLWLVGAGVMHARGWMV